jgi:hypothetical protein
MGRPLRLLAGLALGAVLATATSAAAIAAQPTPPTVEDQHDRRLRNLRAEQAERTQAAVELARSMERHPNATTVGTSPAAIEDRVLRGLKAAQAQRTLAGLELARSMERKFVPGPDISGDVAAPPPARPVPAAPRPGVGMVASLLLGLVGGVVGGCAALAGWAAVARRRLRQPASAT